MTRTNLKKIYSQQKHTIRIIFHKDKSSHTEELFVQNKVFNVDQLNIFNNHAFVHKIKTETAPVFLTKFQKPAHPYPTKFSKLNYRSKYRISVSGPAFWNDFLTEKGK